MFHKYKAVTLYDFVSSSLLAERAFHYLNAKFLCNAVRVTSSTPSVYLIGFSHDVRSFDKHLLSSPPRYCSKVSLSNTESYKTDLFFGTVFFRGVLFVVFFGNPISILNGFHHYIHIFFSHFSAGKKTGHFFHKFFCLSCTSVSIFIFCIGDKGFIFRQKIVEVQIQGFCQLFISIHSSRTGFIIFIGTNYTAGHTDFFS
ncbi:membrane protein [gut metagenome]|uniref:Membrane protein n=1 Tax=gut metagenome TaxID=749906 RepID=J9GI98_9ZZZZ